MISTLLLFATLARPAAVSGCPGTKPNLSVWMTPSRRVDVWTLVREGEDPEGVAVLCDGRGHLLRRIEMPEAEPGEMTARRLDVAGWPSPAIAIVSTYPRADGISADPVLLTWKKGRLREALPDLHLDFADAVCVGSFSPSHEATVAIVEFLSGDECFLCWPKRYRVTTYVWHGAALRRGPVRRTRRRHEDWRSALRELHLRCPQEILAGKPGKR